MQDLMRSQKVSKVRIVHDASVSSLPDEDRLMGTSQHSGDSGDGSCGDESRSSLLSSQELQLRDDVCSHDSGSFHSSFTNTRTSSPGSLLGFRERHRRLKQTLSPVKVYKWSPSCSNESMISQRTPTILFSSSSEEMVHQHRVDNLRSRLRRLSNDSNIIDGPPGLTDAV